MSAERRSDFGSRIIGFGIVKRRFYALKPPSRNRAVLDTEASQSRIGVISQCRAASTSEPNSFTAETA
jgi:hypothetical protein